MDDVAVVLLNAWALDAAAQALALAKLDPARGSQVHRVADGWLVLSGRNMYVNRAIGVGIEAAVSDDDIEFIVSRSESVGVDPAFEVTPLTRADTLARLTMHGFAPDTDDRTTALAITLPTPPAPPIPPTPPIDRIVVRSVSSDDDFALWQELCAAGWGHSEPAARAASDAFSAAARVTDGDGMVIAYDRHDGRPLGCASMTIRDRVATTGGMSTLPAERGRGVQAALIRFRLHLAAERGCAIGATTAVTGGASERNLQRHGFRPRFEITTWTR